MAQATAQDQWPSLPPIRTTGKRSCSIQDDMTESRPDAYSSEAPDGHSGPFRRLNLLPTLSVASAPSSPASHENIFCPQQHGIDHWSSDNETDPQVVINCEDTFDDIEPRSSCCGFLPSFFRSRAGGQNRRAPSTNTSPESRSPWWRRRAGRMDRHGRRRRYRTWQSIALLLIPAGGFSYPSTPTGKAQLFGAPSFPRTLSGSSIDKQNYKSSFTSGPAMSDWQFSTGRSSQFSSPRTIASSKVQHFSGSIPSPRTPFYTSSPAATARRTHPGQKRPSFSLFSPPGVPSINQKRTAFIHQESTVDEPSSPHVNCIGRVRRQSQCKKLFPTDAIEPSSYRRRRDQATDLRGKSGHSDKSGGTSSSFHDQGLRDKPMGNLRSQTSDSHFVNIKPLVLTDNSIQTFGKLLSLHKDEHHSGHGWTPKTEQNVNRSIATNKIDSPSFDGGSHQEGRPRRKVSGEESDHLWQNNVNMIEDSKIHALQYAASRIDTVAGETKSTEFYSLSSTKLKLDSQERDDDACRHGSREMRTARPTTLDEPERCLIVMRSRGSKRLSDDEIGRLMSIG